MPSVRVGVIRKLSLIFRLRRFYRYLYVIRKKALVLGAERQNAACTYTMAFVNIEEYFRERR